jgi:hypothetical protein
MIHKNIFKSTLSTSLISTIVIVFAFGIVSASYGESCPAIEGCPEFNCHSEDLELLVLKNRIKGTGWQDPISADCGDKVAFQIYYHNAAEGTVAENTKIRIDYPDTNSASIESIAYLWADNVSYASDTSTINVSTPQKVVFDDTAKWYPDRSSTPINIPVTKYYRSVEVNIGDIAGGWEHQGQGYVTFEATITECPAPSPTADLKANNSDGPIDLYYKDDVTLSWNSQNVVSCTASGDWSGLKSLSGSENLQLNTVKNYTFTLTCQNSSGQTAQDSVQVNVKAKPPTVITKPAVVTL